MSSWSTASNILAIRLDNIGDVIMLGPALRAIKETLPRARLTLLATPSGATAAALLPWIDQVLVWRVLWQDLGHLPFDPSRERELIELLAAGRYDAAIVFSSFSQSPHPAGYACYLAGIPLRAGESKEFGGRCLTTELTSAPDELHQVERNLRLVEALDFSTRDRGLTVVLPDAARAAVPQLLRDAAIDPDVPFVVLHPGASAAARRYPPERMGEVGRMLSDHGWPVVVTGIEREEALVATTLGAAPAARCLRRSTTLAEYTALIERAALVICGNTLPLHLADAVHTPVLALFSGTDQETQWQPRTTAARLLRRPTPCHPCYLFDCPIGQPCLDILPAEVCEVAESLLAYTKGKDSHVTVTL